MKTAELLSPIKGIKHMKLGKMGQNTMMISHNGFVHSRIGLLKFKRWYKLPRNLIKMQIGAQRT
jgi:hypothetical protein